MPKKPIDIVNPAPDDEAVVRTTERKQKRKRKKLTKALMQHVCDELAKGKSLRSITTADHKMPMWTTVLQKVQRDEDFYEMYARARAIGAEVLADEMHDLAAMPLPEGMDPKLTHAEIQRRRLEVDTKKWTFSKMQPRGVRHKQEDVEGNNSIILMWGSDTPEGTTIEHDPADTAKLVGSNKVH